MHFSLHKHVFLFGLQAKPHDTLDLCVILNDDLSQTVKSNPKRFVGLGTLPMQAPDLAIVEMKRCVKELGFPGVQIGSHINNWDLNASELYPFYAVRDCIWLYTWLYNNIRVIVIVAANVYNPLVFPMTRVTLDSEVKFSFMEKY